MEELWKKAEWRSIALEKLFSVFGCFMFMPYAYLNLLYTALHLLISYERHRVSCNYQLQSWPKWPGRLYLFLLDFLNGAQPPHLTIKYSLHQKYSQSMLILATIKLLLHIKFIVDTCVHSIDLSHINPFPPGRSTHKSSDWSIWLVSRCLDFSFFPFRPPNGHSALVPTWQVILRGTTQSFQQ